MTVFADPIKIKYFFDVCKSINFAFRNMIIYGKET